jgi:hypothetical protein
VQYWNGATFVDVPGGNITGNNLVKRKVIFAPIVTDKIRVLVNNSVDNYFSRIVEIEAFSCTPVIPPTPTPSPTPNPCAIPANNVAAASSGATAVATSEYGPAFAATGVNNGEHNGNDWGSGGWNDGTGGVFPDNVQINFSVSQTINEIDVYTLKDDYNSGSVVTDTTTFTNYGITSYQVQYWTGAAWADVPGGLVTGNNLVKRKFLFPNIVTDRIRVLVNNSVDNYYSRIVEVEAFSCTPLRESLKQSPLRTQLPLPKQSPVREPAKESPRIASEAPRVASEEPLPAVNIKRSRP